MDAVSEIFELAQASARALDEGRPEASRLTGALVSRYTAAALRGDASAWAALPPLSAVLSRFADTFMVSGMRHERERRLVYAGMERVLSEGLANAAPSLSAISSDPRFGVDALQFAVGALLRDAGHHARRASPPRGGIFAKLLGRPGGEAALPGDHVAAFLAAPPAEALCHALAFAALRLARRAVEGGTPAVPLPVLEEMVAMAEAGPASDRVATIAESARGYINVLYVDRRKSPPSGLPAP